MITVVTDVTKKLQMRCLWKILHLLPVCDRLFSNASDLKIQKVKFGKRDEEMNIHTGEKPF